MGESIAEVLGWAVLLLAVGALALAAGRRAAANGILVPVLVGVVLRLVVMLIAHAGSLSLGDHGIFFNDDRTYFRDGTVLAHLWGDGQTPDPSRHDVLGTYQFGYQIYLGTVFTLASPSILLGKLMNVLIGGLSVLLVGIAAGRTLGEQAKLRAAWLAALAPTMVWWSAPLMKEALATMLLALGVLAVTSLPRPRALATVGAVLAALIVVRSAAVLALVVGAAVAVAIAGRHAERRWLSRPLILLGTALAASVTAGVLVISHGDVVNFYHQYDDLIRRMINAYQGSNPAHVPVDAVKSVLTPLPWVFDSGTRNWDRGLYPGQWLLLCALPLAALGLWRLRRRPEAWLLAVTAGTAVVANAFTSGFVFRQRSMVEPLILVLALGGATSWRMAARTSAATLGVVAVVAGVQSRSPAVVAAIVAAAGLLFLLSRRLPDERFKPPPESPMVESFRASLDAQPSTAASLRARVREELGRAVRAARAALGEGRAALVRSAVGLRLAQGGPTEPPAALARRVGLRQRAPSIVLLIALLVVSLLVIPGMRADGSPRLATFDLNGGRPVPALRTRGAVTRDVNGFVVRGFANATVAFRTPAPAPRQGDRTVLLVSAGGGAAVSTNLTLIGATGVRHPLGNAVRWQDRRVDVTPLVRTGPGRLEFSAKNARAESRLFVDQIRGATYPASAIPTAGRWEVAVWVALAMLFVLVVLRRARRHLVLVAAAGLAAFLAWPSVVSAALDPVNTDVWHPAVHASWLDLDDGLLSGTFGSASGLAVQLFHAATPLTGTGVVGARVASLLVGILAIAAIYVLGRRVGGSVGAVAAVSLALLSDPFRLSLATADSTVALVLASCLFLIAVHRVLERADPRAMALLGATGAIAILAEPGWWPGVLAAIVLVGLRAAPRGMARTAIATAVISLGLFALPARLSVAHQAGGDATADVTATATQARNAEFPQRAQEQPVGLGEYVLGEHSPATLVSGTLRGASDGLSAVAQRPVTKLVGLLAFLAGVAGVLALLMLPRLRLLVVVPALVAVVPWFFVSRGVLPPGLAEAAFWPALFAGGAAVAQIAWDAARARWAAPRPAPGLLQRSPLTERGQRPAQPS